MYRCPCYTGINQKDIDMKKLLAIALCSFMLVSLQACNDNTEEETMTQDEMMQDDASQATMEDNMKSPSAVARMSEDEYARYFNLDNYTPEQINEHRRLHDEMDWGNVPGYYPEASTRPLNETDTKYLTEWGHKVMLNEIYARHGMRFEDPDLQQHFSSMAWYSANTDDVTNMLTEQEKENIDFLANHKP